MYYWCDVLIECVGIQAVFLLVYDLVTYVVSDLRPHQIDALHCGFPGPFCARTGPAFILLFFFVINVPHGCIFVQVWCRLEHMYKTCTCVSVLIFCHFCTYRASAKPPIKSLGEACSNKLKTMVQAYRRLVDSKKVILPRVDLVCVQQNDRLGSLHVPFRF